MDWGIAQILDDQKPGSEKTEHFAEHTWRFVDVKETSGVTGTIAYMAPEQANGRNRELTQRTDIFGLGATLYEMLTGLPPYHDLSYWEALGLAQIGGFKPVRDAAPERDVPPALAAIVETAMAPDPSNRYPDAMAFKSQLLAFMHGEASFPTAILMQASQLRKRGTMAMPPTSSSPATAWSLNK